MENNNNNNLGLSNKNDNAKLHKKAQTKPVPKPKPEPTITQKIKELYASTKENALDTINKVLDYALDTFNDFYNLLTNESKPNPNQPQVQLNEEAVTNELIAKAKQDGDTKEVVLNNKNSPNVVGSSLVVDMDAQKVEATISAMDNRLNSPNNKVNEPIESKSKFETELKEDTAPIKAKVEKDNKVEKKLVPELPKPKPKPKLKPEFPKLEPKNKLQPESELKIEPPKPVMTALNVQTNMSAFRNKFLVNQEQNPHILEEQTFQVVLKPQDPKFKIIDKNAATGNVANIMRKLNPQQVPDTIEDVHGVEHKKIKSRLK